MTEQQYHLTWHGPFSWYSADGPSVFDQPVVDEPGLYLWALRFAEHHRVYYVGETGRSLHDRLHTHRLNYLIGKYQIYEPDAFARGERVPVWGGMRTDTPLKRLEVFLQDYVTISACLHCQLQLLQVFVAPLTTDKRTRQRIEYAVRLATCPPDSPLHDPAVQ
jgi:hypothetical protein